MCGFTTNRHLITNYEKGGTIELVMFGRGGVSECDSLFGATDINCSKMYTRDLGAPPIEVAWRSARQAKCVIERERANTVTEIRIWPVSQSATGDPKKPT